MVWVFMSALLVTLNHFHVITLPLWLCWAPMMIPLTGLILAAGILVLAFIFEYGRYR